MDHDETMIFDDPTGTKNQIILRLMFSGRFSTPFGHFLRLVLVKYAQILTFGGFPKNL